MSFELAPLPYDYSALEPYIDTQTMQIHHDKHHAAYVTNLNKALESAPELAGKSINEIVANLSAVPEKIRQAVINNGGGHYNHTLFWEIMGPKGGGEPKGDLAKAIDAAFGNYEGLREKMNNAGMTRFGSGWAWLVADQSRSAASAQHGQSRLPVVQRPAAARRHRCVGARLLSEVSESPRRLFGRVVECGKLGRGGGPVCRPEEVVTR